MVEKYINLNLNDENAGKIAEIISNKTAKKILSVIAETEKELTETDISNKLGIALNTVDYNIKKLLEAGLIEKSTNFFWSVKGKKIPTFKIANKKIIISSKSSYKGILGSMLIFGALGFLGNVSRNIFSVSKSLYSSTMDYSSNLNEQIVSKATESGTSLISSPETIGGVAGLTAPNASFSFASLFSNVWVWVLIGVLIGALGYILYKKFKNNIVKGGNKI